MGGPAHAAATAAIEHPSTPDGLYLMRLAEVDPYRPIMSGDVFEASISSLEEEHNMVMVISHPCSMRAGAHLRRQLQVIPVSGVPPIASHQWGGFNRVMPLPDLLRDGQTFAASFDLSSPIRSSDLALDARVACLSEYGILVTYQRHIRHLTRFELAIADLAPATRSIFTEIALQDDWNQALVRPLVEAGGDITNLLHAEEKQFDEFMHGHGTTGQPLRAELEDQHLHASVRRAVALEIQRRRP